MAVAWTKRERHVGQGDTGPLLLRPCAPCWARGSSLNGGEPERELEPGTRAQPSSSGMGLLVPEARDNGKDGKADSRGQDVIWAVEQPAARGVDTYWQSPQIHIRPPPLQDSESTGSSSTNGSARGPARLLQGAMALMTSIADALQAAPRQPSRQSTLLAGKDWRQLRAQGVVEDGHLDPDSLTKSASTRQKMASCKVAPVTSPSDSMPAASVASGPVTLSVATSADPLLPPQSQQHAGKKTLVLDLDETLVHSSFLPMTAPDFVLPVIVNTQSTAIHVLKRPLVDIFLLAAAEDYELVVFTASLPMYADPLLDQLDTDHLFAHRLFRDSCQADNTGFIKDLSRLGRDLSQTIIVDNSPQCFSYQPENAICIPSFFDDPQDRELLEVLGVLRKAARSPDVRVALKEAAYCSQGSH